MNHVMARKSFQQFISGRDPFSFNNNNVLQNSKEEFNRCFFRNKSSNGNTRI